MEKYYIINNVLFNVQPNFIEKVIYAYLVIQIALIVMDLKILTVLRAKIMNFYKMASA